MALSDIKSILEEDLGVGSISLARINRAAKELYINYELLDSQREVTLDRNRDELVALPWFVDKLIAVRPNTNYSKVRLNHRINKYRTGDWQDVLTLEDAGRSPLHTNIMNAAVVKLSIPKPETAVFSVTITGGNNLSSSLSETITFAVGETEKYSANRYRDIHAIAQVRHKYDLTISDIDDVELALLPNHLEEAQYRIIRTSDPARLFSYIYAYVDVLFKPPYRPFVNDGDQFICGDRYDRAIVYKYLADIYMGQDQAKAGVFTNMSEAQVLQVSRTSLPTSATLEIAATDLPYREYYPCYHE
jgi:hypothetical protein